MNGERDEDVLVVRELFHGVLVVDWMVSHGLPKRGEVAHRAAAQLFHEEVPMVLEHHREQLMWQHHIIDASADASWWLFEVQGDLGQGLRSEGGLQLVHQLPVAIASMATARPQGCELGDVRVG